MDAKLFAQMLADKKAWDLRRMQYKYSAAAVTEFVELLKIVAYRELPLKDCAGAPVVYQPKAVSQSCAAIRTLHTPENSPFAVQAMQDEIQATLNIEQIRTSRHSIRRILQGFTPADHKEERLLGMKQGHIRIFLFQRQPNPNLPGELLPFLKSAKLSVRYLNVQQSPIRYQIGAEGGQFSA